MSDEPKYYTVYVTRTGKKFYSLCAYPLWQAELIVRTGAGDPFGFWIVEPAIQVSPAFEEAISELKFDTE